MPKPKSENIEEPVEDFGNPEELMPIPDRLRGVEASPVTILEFPVRSPEPEIRALPVEPVSGIVEPDSLATIRARRDAHLANSRR